MKKELFIKEPRFPIALVFGDEQFSFYSKNEMTRLFKTPNDIRMLFSQWDTFSFEQHRCDSNGWKNSMETCFIISWKIVNEIKYIDAHLVNYSNKTLIIVLKGYDKFWPFTIDLPFPSNRSMEFLKQLIHLYNQENLYFYIYTWNEIKKMLKIKNPFQFSWEIEKLLLDINIDNITESGYLTWLKDIMQFFATYSGEYLKRIISTGGNYHFIA